MFLAEVVAVHADESFMNDKNKFEFFRARPMVYSMARIMAWGNSWNLRLQREEEKIDKYEDEKRKISFFYQKTIF